MVMPLFLKVTLCFAAIFSSCEKSPVLPEWGTGPLKALWLLQLFSLEVLAGGAADGAFIGGLYALHLLAADGADHRDGHRRVRDLAVLGLYLLTGVAGEVGDGDLAGYDVLHRVARPGERIFNEREVYVRHAALACQFLSHVARDVPHEALGRPLQTLDGLLGPRELLRPALGDQRAGLLEGAVVYGALAAGGILHLLLGVADRAAAALDLRGFATGLLAILLLDVLAGDGSVPLLERALLDAGFYSTLLLPLFEAFEEGLRLVGPVQLAPVIDLGEVEVLVRTGRGYLRVYGVEVGRAGAADRTASGFALRYVAAPIALEAVLALGGAPDLFLHLRRDTLDVTPILALAEAATAGLEDLLFRDMSVPVTVRLGVGRAVRAVGLRLVGGALVKVLEERVYGLLLAHRLGGAHLVADGAHGLHRAGREDVLYDLVYDAGGYDRVALLDGVADDRARRHAADEAGHPVHPLQGLLGPGDVLLGGVEVGGLVLEVGDEDVRRQVAHHVFGVAAYVHLVVGVVADAAHHHERRVRLVYVLEGLLERFAGQQGRL